MDASTKIAAATELLNATRRDLQLLDVHIAQLQQGRSAVEQSGDVSSEHRASWLGATDDLDQGSGIFIGTQTPLTREVGFDRPHTGTIRNQEDAAFVCTGILVALARVNFDAPMKFETFFEDAVSQEDDPLAVFPACRLTDGNTGRSLIAGMTVGPQDLARGAVPFSYLSSIRPGLGANVKNKLFAEFTIPRSGTVKVELFNIAPQFDIFVPPQFFTKFRACVTLLGYKVFGA